MWDNSNKSYLTIVLYSAPSHSTATGFIQQNCNLRLQAHNKMDKLITPGSSVLDLGCAPGAWLQVACQSLGPLKNGGLVVGIDLKVSFFAILSKQKVKVPADHCDSRVQTVFHEFPTKKPTQKGFSVVLSGMCPLVSGISSRDAALSLELGMQALNVAVGGAALAHSNNEIQTEESNVGATTSSDDNGVLRRGGNLVIKLLESEAVQEINQICKPLFRKASLLRPKATDDEKKKNSKDEGIDETYEDRELRE
ncbi:hypothetical protein DVH24_023083 [Malus domestica]|uniref:rRNA methyltransferase 2, mitochondrial n=1 Tax=Malus domestica TaxID=3750 RepID=A0A498KLA0_MALDO|nr:hypothetical protein DVH24_023083 [Malus domestica]